MLMLLLIELIIRNDNPLKQGLKRIVIELKKGEESEIINDNPLKQGFKLTS